MAETQTRLPRRPITRVPLGGPVTTFIASKVLDAVLSVLAVATFVFVVSRLLGDPTTLLMPMGTPEELLQDLRVQLGLDQPIYVQYLRFLADLLRGDLGQSFQFMRPAMDVVLERLPATLLLTGSAVLLGVVLGVAVGIAAALYRGTLLEPIAMLVVLVGQATPVFWLALMLILYFSVNLGWFPTGGYGTWQHFIMPSFTLGLGVAAIMARFTRSSFIEIAREDYVRTARAKGVPERRVIWKHSLRNALIPIITMVGLQFGFLLGGSIVVESVFSWPGLGRLLVDSVSYRDYPVIQALILLFSLQFIFINMLVDVLYAFANPEIRYK